MQTHIPQPVSRLSRLLNLGMMPSKYNLFTCLCCSSLSSAKRQTKQFSASLFVWCLSNALSMIYWCWYWYCQDHGLGNIIMVWGQTIFTAYYYFSNIFYALGYGIKFWQNLVAKGIIKYFSRNYFLLPNWQENKNWLLHHVHELSYTSLVSSISLICLNSWTWIINISPQSKDTLWSHQWLISLLSFV